jgi:hypothetical protein
LKRERLLRQRRDEKVRKGTVVGQLPPPPPSTEEPRLLLKTRRFCLAFLY